MLPDRTKPLTEVLLIYDMKNKPEDNVAWKKNDLIVYNAAFCWKIITNNLKNIKLHTIWY